MRSVCIALVVVPFQGAAGGLLFAVFLREVVGDTRHSNVVNSVFWCVLASSYLIVRITFCKSSSVCCVIIQQQYMHQMIQASQGA